MVSNLWFRYGVDQPGEVGPGEARECHGHLVSRFGLSVYVVRFRVRVSGLKRFRGGLVFKAHRLLYHSTLGLRVIKKKKFGVWGRGVGWTASPSSRSVDVERLSVRPVTAPATAVSTCGFGTTGYEP